VIGGGPCYRPIVRTSAFTLVEVAIVVAIIGFVVAVALPGVSDTVTRAQKIAALDRIESVLKDGRNEARLRRVCVNVAAPSLTGGVGAALRLAVDVACDGDFTDTDDVVRDPLTIGELRFPDAVAAEGITFGPRGGLQAGSPTLIEGRAAEISRLYRVLPAIGALRRER
jgi:Tfp pilus assembly protein FimT